MTMLRPRVRRAVVPRQGRHSEAFKWRDSATMKLLEPVAMQAGEAALAPERRAIDQGPPSRAESQSRSPAATSGQYSAEPVARVASAAG